MDSIATVGSADFTDEVLAENGYGSATNRATLIHNSSTGNSILVPESEGLTPPPIIDESTAVDTVDSYNVIADALAELDAAVNEEQERVVRDDNNQVRLVSTAQTTGYAQIDDDMINDIITSSSSNDVWAERPNTDTYTTSVDMAQEYPATTEEAINVRTAITAMEQDEEDLELHEEVADETETLIATATNTDAMDLAMEEALEGAVETSDNEEPIETKQMIDMLPENPKSLLALDETTSRFSGAAWFNAVQNSTVVLAGLGGIGSYILFLLSRMKPRQVFIYDDDVVEMANLSGQLYSKSMVGKKKVNAMANLADDFSDYHGVMAIDSRWDETKSPSDIMICGFDNMEARNMFFRSWLHHLIGHQHPENCLFIDGRF